MYRKVYEYLRNWKESKYRKPLIIQGSRQVGKTYVILEFGKENYNLNIIEPLTYEDDESEDRYESDFNHSGVSINCCG